MTGQWQVRAALLAAAGETHTNLSPEVDPVAVTLYSGNLLALLSELNSVNGTRHFIRPADDRDDWYDYTTYNRNVNLNGTPVASIDATSDNVVAVDGWRISADTVVNQQQATVDWPSFPQTPILVWEYDGSLPLTVVDGAPFTMTATYSDYVLSCPTLAYTATGDDIDIVLTNQGWGAQLTLTSDGTTVFTELALYGREAVREPEQTFLADNLTSQAFPRGVRAAPDINGDMVGIMASARGIANHMVWRYSGLTVDGHLVPMKRPSVTVVNWLPTAFRHDLYEVVDVTSTQLRVSGDVFEIVGLSETVTRAPDTGDCYVATTYQLQESRLQSPFTWFTLDVSALDTGSDPGTIFGFEGVAGDETVDLSWSVSSGGSADPLAY